MSSKWRAVPLNCLYVIPDIHGQYDSLKLICNRILPLRKSDGGKDRLVFLGDYIDRGPKTPEVIDLLIQIGKDFGEQVVFLKGNHEQMLLDAIKPSIDSNKYLFWMKNGGEQTLSSYLDRANNHLDNPYELMRYRAIDFIPKDHLAFFNSLRNYYEFEDYVFVHAGCDTNSRLSNQDVNELFWDDKLFNHVREKGEQNWEKIIVTGHHGQKDGNPIITEKFLMLDCSYGKKLIVVELRSMEAFSAGRNKGRLFKIDLSNYQLL